MTVNFDTWLGNTNPLTTTTVHRWAARALKRIQRHPASVIFTPVVGTDLAAQTVRLDWDNGASMASSDAGAAPTRKLTILGIRDHATLANTDIKTGYTFWLNKKEYRVIHVAEQIGQIEATAEAVG